MRQPPSVTDTLPLSGGKGMTVGLFRRKKRVTQESQADAELPLSVDQAARLRSLTRTAFAEAGREVTVYADHVEDDAGARFGLWNLAALCREHPTVEWPQLVHDHVRRLVASPGPSLEDMSDGELRASTYLRLVEAGGVPDRSWHPTARRLGDDLLVVLSVDLPETVSTPPERDWEARGGLDGWREIGAANLRALLVSDDVVHERVGHGGAGGDFDVVVGDPFFTGSLPLLMGEVVQRFTPGVDLSRGVLVVVPFRHQFAWRVVDGPDAAVALDHLFRFALLASADAPGPLSPHVFWVRHGEWRQVTRLVDDQPQVIVEADLAAALGLDGEQ